MMVTVTVAKDVFEEATAFYQECARETKLDRSDILIVAKSGVRIVGIVRLCFEEGVHVLRTMQIHPDFQRKGIGSLLLHRFDELLKERGIRKIYCLPYEHLERFYGQIGFKRISTETAPRFLQDRLANFAKKTPHDRAILMARIDLLSEIKIRVAVLGDNEPIARVHIQAWQEAYAGLIPEDYLIHLSSELENRIAMWKRALENRERWIWVAEDDRGIVGFVLFGPPRDQYREGFIELGALYLLASAQKKKAGFALLSAGFRGMRALGYSKAYCWVLENNPTTKFYEKTGARLSSQVKQDEIGGKTFNELAYVWDNIEAIANAFRE